MLARLQQAIALTQWTLALIVLIWLMQRGQPLWALGASLLILAAHAPFLAFEFVLLRRINRDDPAPPASIRQLLRAWWGEVLMAWRVFSWRQPFRSRAEADVLPPGLPASDAVGRQGVVLVHGYVCNRGFWNPWLQTCRQRGVPAVAVNLEPMFGDIDDYAQAIDTAVAQVCTATGQPPVLVCHSMGGLAARAWLRARAAHARVAGIYTIGSPHQGTWLARCGHTTNARQMRQGGPWLAQLEADEAAHKAGGVAAAVPFVCYYGHADNIVFPASTACLPGAEHRFIAATAHVAMAFVPEVMQSVLDEVQAHDANVDAQASVQPDRTPGAPARAHTEPARQSDAVCGTVPGA